MCAKKVAKKFRPLCGLRRPFRLQRNRAGRSHAGRVLLRAQNSLRSFRGPARKPGTFRSAKKHKFQRQQLANLCFFNASLRWPRNPNGKRGGVFRRARNSKNDIRALTRVACAGKRDLESGGQPRACRCRGNYFCAAPFRTHAVRNAGLCAGLKPHRARRDSQYHFSTHP